MGILLIENHISELLHVDWVGAAQAHDLPAKQGDVPGRLIFDLQPGRHDFNITTSAGGRGHIGLTIAAGQAFVSPIWYNDSPEEKVYPLEIPDGCQ